MRSGRAANDRRPPEVPGFWRVSDVRRKHWSLEASAMWKADAAGLDRWIDMSGARRRSVLERLSKVAAWRGHRLIPLLDVDAVPETDPLFAALQNPLVNLAVISQLYEPEELEGLLLTGATPQLSAMERAAGDACLLLSCYDETDPDVYDLATVDARIAVLDAGGSVLRWAADATTDDVARPLWRHADPLEVNLYLRALQSAWRELMTADPRQFDLSRYPWLQANRRVTERILGEWNRQPVATYRPIMEREASALNRPWGRLELSQERWERELQAAADAFLERVRLVEQLVVPEGVIVEVAGPPPGTTVP